MLLTGGWHWYWNVYLYKQKHNKYTYVYNIKQINKSTALPIIVNIVIIAQYYTYIK